MILTITRTFKEALSNFWRNSWLTVASVSVLILSLYILGVIYVEVFAIGGVLKDIQEKVNVSASLKLDVSEEQILKIKSEIEKNSLVKSVDYTSREKALENFKRDNANEPTILQSLDEIGENPLLASLAIKANDPGQYQTIVDYMNSADFKENISRINYDKYKPIIEKLNNNIYAIRRSGIILSIIFILIGILTTFNTIRITIYTHRQEIEVMRLVGASNAFIRLPFIFEGMVYGLVASIVAALMLFLTFRFAPSYISPMISSDISAKGLLSVFLDNFWMLFGLQLFIGIALGVVSSLVAIRKYLKI